MVDQGVHLSMEKEKYINNRSWVLQNAFTISLWARYPRITYFDRFLSGDWEMPFRSHPWSAEFSNPSPIPRESPIMALFAHAKPGSKNGFWDWPLSKCLPRLCKAWTCWTFSYLCPHVSYNLRLTHHYYCLFLYFCQSILKPRRANQCCASTPDYPLSIWVFWQ